MVIQIIVYFLLIQLKNRRKKDMFIHETMQLYVNGHIPFISIKLRIILPNLIFIYDNKIGDTFSLTTMKLKRKKKRLSGGSKYKITKCINKIMNLTWK